MMTVTWQKTNDREIGIGVPGGVGWFFVFCSMWLRPSWSEKVCALEHSTSASDSSFYLSLFLSCKYGRSFVQVMSFERVKFVLVMHLRDVRVTRTACVPPVRRVVAPWALMTEAYPRKSPCQTDSNRLGCTSFTTQQ